MKAIKMLSSKSASSLIMTIIVMVLACQKDTEILSSVDTQNVNSEAASSAFVNENSDISSIVMSNLTIAQYTSGRSEVSSIPNLGGIDGRLTCAAITVTSTGTRTSPSGVIVVTFDSTCVDTHNITRKGTITIAYNGRRWQAGSTYSIQLARFFRNGVHIEGAEYDTAKKSIDSLHLQFASWLVGGKITFADGGSITRDHAFIKTWYRSSDPTQPGTDEWHIEGAAYGSSCKDNSAACGTNNKNNSEYVMQITVPLIQRFTCWKTNHVAIPVKGTKAIIVTSSTNSKTYTVDYGDGTCDNLVTVTVNGKEKVISVSGDGN